MTNPLKNYRAHAGKTQAQLAADLNVAVMTVSRWETGERKIGAKSLQRVWQVTGIPARELRPDLAASLEAAQ
jgi:transcriptional regulator with XRE-family HTH domain